MFLAKLLLSFALTAGLSAIPVETAAAQTDYSANPTYKKDKPQFSAQNYNGDFVVYDSYWTKDQWKIHCSKEQFCYLHFDLKHGLGYNGTELGDKLQFDPSKQTEHSLALSVKNSTFRSYFSIPFFKYKDRVYTSRWQDYEGKDRPSGEVKYWIDGNLAASLPFRNRIPMFFSMYTDFEPETVDAMNGLRSWLYYDDPQEMIVKVYFDDTPVVGTVFNISGFKDAYDEMVKERTARNELAKIKSIKFVTWPSVE